MRISNEYDITRNANGLYLLNGAYVKTVEQKELEILYRACRGLSDEGRISQYNKLIAEGKLPTFAAGNIDTTVVGNVAESEVILSTMNDLIKFFSEFAFQPNYRFVNTFVHKIRANAWMPYVCNYFRLIDSPYAQEIADKVNSKEFKDIVGRLKMVTPKRTVNSRLKIYFGPQGTGKTTAATKESPVAIVCNASLLPQDLMEDFTFDDGKATFHPSMLARCMEEGKPIVLDEINLLPFDSLRFLQGLTDEKSEINYKGNTVHIKEGFKIIGTMNLTVNGVTFGLPEPLADRCETIDEYCLTANQLVEALL